MRSRPKYASILICVVLLAACANAEPVASLKPTDCVNDFAGVLSPATITQLKEMCRQVLDKAQASVVVVTVKSTDGEDIFDLLGRTVSASGESDRKAKIAAC